jgi:fructose-1,6-bisphosphatase/inositol monophosphatase family enzyme
MALFSLADLSTLSDLLRDVSRAEILPRFRRLEAGDVRAKSGPLDLVTEADEAAERVITDGLQRMFPGCVVVGEEACAADPPLLAALDGAELAFVLDPIDGTANYAAGLPLFGCMAAVVMQGEIVASAIHDPMGDDTAFALRGEGAWMEAPGGARAPIRSSLSPAISAAVGRLTGKTPTSPPGRPTPLPACHRGPSLCWSRGL